MTGRVIRHSRLRLPHVTGPTEDGPRRGHPDAATTQECLFQPSHSYAMSVGTVALWRQVPGHMLRIRR